MEVLRFGLGSGFSLLKRSVFKRLSFPTNYYQQNYATGSADRVLVHDRLVFPNNFFERNSLHSSIPRERVPGPKASNSNSKSSSFSFGKSVEMRCFRCLSPDHHVANCCNQVRCKSCFFYGHMAHSSQSSRTQARVYRAKKESGPGQSSS